MFSCQTLFGRDEATRTPDPYVPNVVRYQLRYIPKNYHLLSVCFVVLPLRSVITGEVTPSLFGEKKDDSKDNISKKNGSDGGFRGSMA